MFNDPLKPVQPTPPPNDDSDAIAPGMAAEIRTLANAAQGAPPRLTTQRQTAMLAAAGQAISQRVAAQQQQRHRRMPWLRIGSGLAAAAAIGLVVWAGLGPLVRSTNTTGPLATGGQGSNTTIASKSQYGSADATEASAQPSVLSTQGSMAARQTQPVSTAATDTAIAEARTLDAVDALLLARAIGAGNSQPDLPGGLGYWDSDGDGRLDQRDVDAILNRAVRLVPTIGALDEFFRDVGIATPSVFDPFRTAVARTSAC